MARGRKKSSAVWEHFSTPDEKNNVIYRHCKAILQYCNSTSSLMKHLKKKHVFIKVSETEDCTRPTASGPSTSSICNVDQPSEDK